MEQLIMSLCMLFAIFTTVCLFKVFKKSVFKFLNYVHKIGLCNCGAEFDAD